MVFHSFFAEELKRAARDGAVGFTRAIVKEALVGTARLAGRTALFYGKKAGEKMPSLWMGAGHSGQARFIGPWNRLRAPTTLANSRVALVRGPDGRPYTVQRATGSGRTRIPLRFFRRSGFVGARVTPRFGFGGVAGSELDVANFSYPVRRTRRRSAPRRPTRRTTRVKRFSVKKRRTYRRRR